MKKENTSIHPDYLLLNSNNDGKVVIYTKEERTLDINEVKKFLLRRVLEMVSELVKSGDFTIKTGIGTILEINGHVEELNSKNLIEKMENEDFSIIGFDCFETFLEDFVGEE